ncbi:MAG: (Fe-S)-binding protein [Chloroflexota bacterium]
MDAVVRASPRHKPVSLFATCMVDSIFPPVGMATVRILDYLDIPLTFPEGQTCCGQPAFNAGAWDDARPVARQFMRAFADAEVIVTPSGSCASMVRHFYPMLFADDPALHQQAVHAASITWELTEYLVDGLGVTDLGGRLPPTRVALHHACHGLRLGGLRDQARQLVDAIDGVTVVDLPGAETCCGFGGLFAVKMAPVSTAMLREKIAAIEATDADVVLTGDAGCMAHINGGLQRARVAPQVRHVASLIADSLQTPVPDSTRMERDKS